MSSFLSSNGRIFANFDNIHLKLSTHAYFEERFSFCCENTKILKIDFYDVITIELYWDKRKFENESREFESAAQEHVEFYLPSNC